MKITKRWGYKKLSSLYLGLWAVNPSYICDPKKTHFKILIMHHGAIISDSKCICYSDQVTRKRNSHCFSMSMVYQSYQSTFVPFRIHRERHLSGTIVSHSPTHKKHKNAYRQLGRLKTSSKWAFSTKSLHLTNYLPLPSVPPTK